MSVVLSLSRNSFLAASVVMLAWVAATGIGLAQSGLSEDEILERWKAQAEQIESGQVALKTRGIAVNDGRDSGTGDAGITVSTNFGSGPTPNSPSEPTIYDRDITVDMRVTFETNSAFIRPSAAKELGKICGAMTAAPSNWTFNIIGHADASGSPKINRPLSEARADEVARRLQSECGIAGSRFSTFGLGESRLLPGVPPVSEENRRVEVSIGRI